MAEFVLAIDQGTTSSRALLFDRHLACVAIAQEEFAQHFPRSGWVEHDPEALWSTTVATCRAVLEKANVEANAIAAIGITNQRETTVVWDRASGRPICNAIVWQDRRTADACALLKEAGHEADVARRTGLLLDPYFSATKIAWILDHVDGARSAANAGALAFGTVDSFLLWRLTGGATHATDATNASRTMLYDIVEGDWSDALLDLFDIPRSLLPDVRDCNADFGMTTDEVFGRKIPISGIAGDQQAAMVGQACFEPGMTKSTYGTGCFALLNTGAQPVMSRNRLLTTIAYQFDGQTRYALEGSIFVAGAGVQWLRDGLGLIESVAEVDALASSSDPEQDVYLVPAFTGLGAPYWDAEARGAVYGLTRATGAAEFARATLESVCYQSRDLLEAMRRDWLAQSHASEAADFETVLRVDGGMVASDWTMQCLADMLDAPVDRPTVLEATARGAAYIAGLRGGFYPPPDAFAQSWTQERRFVPALPEEARERKYAGWKDAVNRTLTR